MLFWAELKEKCTWNESLLMIIVGISEKNVYFCNVITIVSYLTLHKEIASLTLCQLSNWNVGNFKWGSMTNVRSWCLRVCYNNIRSVRCRKVFSTLFGYISFSYRRRCYSVLSILKVILRPQLDGEQMWIPTFFRYVGNLNTDFFPP